MQNCYERNSVEDLVRLSRIDSEALFQRWLNRIPSAGALNEAAALQQQLEHVSAGPTADLLAASAAMPRVPSLQFLTQLASAQQLANAAAIRDQAAALVAPSAGFGALPTAALPSTSVNGNARDVDPELTAAKALNQLSQPHSHSHVTNGMSEGTSPSSNDKDVGGKSDNRKARRMLSNRESARRSRKRKQEHLSKLEQEINVMLEEKRTWTEKASSLERQCTSMEDENGRLREENARLRDELQFLRSELSCLTRRRLHHHDDDTRPSNDLKQET